MCTLALYLRQFDDYPLVIAANRDEHFSRPSAAPRVISGDPTILAGTDLVAGGTWLGVNAHGVATGILNRRSPTEKVIIDPRSRGLLCLDMLRGENAAQARDRLKREEPARYQPFVLLVASTTAAFVAFNSGNAIECIELSAGLHVFSNSSFTAESGGKLDRAHQLFSAAAESLGVALETPVEMTSAVAALRGVLTDHASDRAADSRDAICLHTGERDYGTVSSSIILQPRRDKSFHFYHAAGAPCRTPYEAVET